VAVIAEPPFTAVYDSQTRMVLQEVMDLTGKLSRGSWTLACFDIDTFRLLPFHVTRSRHDIAVHTSQK